MVERFLRGIDNLNDWTGKIVRWLIIPMTVITAYEVVARYVFNAPTRWAWDINVQLLGVMATLLGGYALLHGSHVIVDVFSNLMNPRKKAILDMVLWMLFFFAFAIAAWQWGISALTSVRIRETTSTALEAPLYPLRITITIGLVLLLLQGVSHYIRIVRYAISPDKAKSEKGDD